MFLQGGKKVELARQEIPPPWWSDLETQIVRETYNVSSVQISQLTF